MSGLSGVAGAVGVRMRITYTPPPPQLSLRSVRRCLIRLPRRPRLCASSADCVARWRSCVSPRWAFRGFAVRLLRQMASSCVTHHCCTDASRRHSIICSMGRRRGKKRKEGKSKKKRLAHIPLLLSLLLEVMFTQNVLSVCKVMISEL